MQNSLAFPEMNQFNITEESPIEIFTVSTTWDTLWNPGVDYYKITNYKDYMNTLEIILEDKEDFIILCKLEDNFFGFMQDADVEGWGGIYDKMDDSAINFWKDKILSDQRTICKVPQLV